MNALFGGSFGFVSCLTDTTESLLQNTSINPGSDGRFGGVDHLGRWLDGGHGGCWTSSAVRTHRSNHCWGMRGVNLRRRRWGKAKKAKVTGCYNSWRLLPSFLFLQPQVLCIALGLRPPLLCFRDTLPKVEKCPRCSFSLKTGSNANHQQE